MSLPSLFNLDEPAALEPDATASPPPANDTATAREAAPATAAQTQSLYRKYRPQSFAAAELVGQEHVVRTLRNAILLGRVAHAYLFCGPRGTGKTTTARLLAKAVNCLDPEPGNRPCNACANCDAINRGATTDVIEIDAASNRGIDDIRDLRERVKYAPTQLSTKFYIIDEAHQITGAAANAFLKTLEEPPAHTKFVLATTDPEELLPTIVSRCQRFDFRRINLGALLERLRLVAAAEDLEIADDALAVIARHATGSLRDALGLLDQLAVYRESDHDASPVRITADAVRAVLGVSRNERVAALARALAERDPRTALEQVNAAVDAGEDPRQLNRQLVAYLRVLLHERASGSPDADDEAKALAARFDLLELAHLARRFSEIDYRIRHSSYSQLPLEVALVESVLAEPAGRITTAPPTAEERPAAPPRPDEEERPPRTTPLRDRVRRPTPQTERAAEVQPEAPPAASAPPPPPEPIGGASNGTPPAGAGPLSVDTIADLWPQIRRDVKAVNRRIEALLQNIDPVAINGDLITLASPYDFHRKRLNEEEVRTMIEDVISRLVNDRVRITCVMKGEEPQPLAVVPPHDSPAAPSQTVAPATPHEPPADPPAPPDDGAGNADDLDEQRIKAAMNIFDAEKMRS